MQRIEIPWESVSAVVGYRLCREKENKRMLWRTVIMAAACEMAAPAESSSSLRLVVVERTEGVRHVKAVVMRVEMNGRGSDFSWKSR